MGKVIVRILFVHTSPWSIVMASLSLDKPSITLVNITGSLSLMVVKAKLLCEKQNRDEIKNRLDFHNYKQEFQYKL